MVVEKDYKKEVIQVPCSCGCGVFEIHAWDVGENVKPEWEYYALYYKLWYGYKSNIRKAVKEKLKLLWCALTGKEYFFYDVILERKDLEALRDELIHILEVEQNEEQ